MTRPIRLEHFAECVHWWGGPRREGRVVTPSAWRMTAEEVRARGYNLDVSNPYTPERRTDDPEKLLKQLNDVDEVAATLRTKLKTMLAEALTT